MTASQAERTDLIMRELGELRGEMKGVVAAVAGLSGQFAERSRVDDAAHRAQDDRITRVSAEIAEERGQRTASVRWAASISGFAGIAIGAVISRVQHLLH